MVTITKPQTCQIKLWSASLANMDAQSFNVTQQDYSHKADISWLFCPILTFLSSVVLVSSCTMCQSLTDLLVQANMASWPVGTAARVHVDPLNLEVSRLSERAQVIWQLSVLLTLSRAGEATNSCLDCLWIYRWFYFANHKLTKWKIKLLRQTPIQEIQTLPTIQFAMLADLQHVSVWTISCVQTSFHNFISCCMCQSFRHKCRLFICLNWATLL